MPDFPMFPSLPGLVQTKRTSSVQTTRLQSRTGRRFAQPVWPYPLYQYEVDLAFLRGNSTYQEWQTFQGFWNTVMTTPGQLFVFVDKDDCTVTNQLIGIGDGVRNIWQAMRSVGGFFEPVTAVLTNVDDAGTIVDCGLVTDSVTVVDDAGSVADPVDLIDDDGGISLTHFYVDGVEVDVTVFASGSLQFASPPSEGATISWDGKFGWLCQFDEDDAEFDRDLPNIYEVQQLTFTTARPNA